MHAVAWPERGQARSGDRARPYPRSWPATRGEVEAKAAGLLGETAAGRLFAAVDELGDGDRFDPARLAATVRAVSS